MKIEYDLKKNLYKWCTLSIK